MTKRPGVRQKTAFRATQTYVNGQSGKSGTKMSGTAELRILGAMITMYAGTSERLRVCVPVCHLQTSLGGSSSLLPTD